MRSRLDTRLHGSRVLPGKRSLKVCRACRPIESLEFRCLLSGFAPVARDDSYSIPLNSAMLVNPPGVLANDTDADGNPLTAILMSGPAHGTFSFTANGAFNYIPDSGFSGSDSFAYKANDGTLDSNVANVSITVGTGTGTGNHAPVAGDDSYSTPMNATLITGAPGVLGNDTDADGDALTAVLASGPAHGTLSLSGNGSFTYTPNANFSGSDSFTYAASDGKLSSTAVVSITVGQGAGNHAPVAGSDTYSTATNTPLVVTLPGVLGNDTDADGDVLTAILSSGPAHGTLGLNADGSFTYTPNANFSGVDSFAYAANDGKLASNTAQVSIAVGSVGGGPVAADDNYTALANTPLVIPQPGVLLNDSDPNRGPLTAILVSGPAHGTVGLNANGAFTYTPNANFNGTDSFTYMASNGTLNSNTAGVSITIGSGSSVPVAADDNYAVAANAPLVMPQPGVLLNDSDPNRLSLTAVLLSGPAHGTVGLNANGAFTYTPNANFNGTDSFTYMAYNGTLDSNPATVSITVGAGGTNHAPVAGSDTYSTPVNTTLAVAASGVLANDTDADGDNLTAILLSGPAHGTVGLNVNGSFTYTPTTGFTGTDSFTYKANDGRLDSNTATASITVGAGTTNHAPVAVSDSYSTALNTPLLVNSPGVLANDTDADGNPLTSRLLSGPAHGTLTLNANGSFTYAPTNGFIGTDSFTYKASDGTLDSNVASVSITVSAGTGNHAPVAGDNSYATPLNTTLFVTAPGVLANDTDADGNPLTAVLVTGPAHGTLSFNANGSFTYAPTTGFSGADSFTYKANDGTLDSNVASVSITVGAGTGNHAPVAGNDAYSTQFNTALLVMAPGILANDSDADGNPLSTVLLSLPAHGSLGLNANGSFTYTPNTGFSGSDSFTYKANDGTLDSNVASVSITVGNGIGNHAPVAGNNNYSTPPDTALVASPGILANDTDADGDTLTAILVSPPTHGGLSLNADGTFTYVPATGFAGTDTFTYKANDGALDSNVATVTISVVAGTGNHAPVAGNHGYSTQFNTALVVTAPGVLVNATDANSDALTAVLASGPAHGTLSLNADGSFTYTPNVAFTGTDTFTYRANDGALDSNIASVSITVNAGVGQTAPVAGNNTYTTPLNTALVVAAPGILADDTATSALTAILVAAPQHGALSFDATGAFTYTPNSGFTGTDGFTYKASDGTLDSNVANVSITVTANAGNHAPVAADGSYSTTLNTALITIAPGVLANATDADGDALTAILVSSPRHGTLNLNANGSFTYAPDTTFTGTDSFTYKASDGSSDSNVAVVGISIIVAGPTSNHPPTASGFTVLRNPGSAARVDVLSHAGDLDGDPLGISVSSAPAHGRAIVNNNGTPFNFTDDYVEYIPNTDYFGSDSFVYTVSDNQGGSTSAIATIQPRKVGLSPNPFNPATTDLVVLGTAGNDEIRLIQSGTRGVKVVLNGVNMGVFTPSGRVIVDALAGNDVITAAGLKHSVWLYGGTGNDLLTGTKFAMNYLFGGAGRNTLVRGTRADLLR